MHRGQVWRRQLWKLCRLAHEGRCACSCLSAALRSEVRSPEVCPHLVLVIRQAVRRLRLAARHSYQREACCSPVLLEHADRSRGGARPDLRLCGVQFQLEGV